MDWRSIFTTMHRKPRGASARALARLQAELPAPLSAQELAELAASQTNPFPRSDPLHRSYAPFDARRWRLPARPLSASYLTFLAWSNGGEFETGSRSFQFFSTSQLREMLLAYHVPQYLPDCLPFAFNGGGCFYLFDMSRPPRKGEYPVLFCRAGALARTEAVRLGTFVRTLSSRMDPEDLLS